MSWPTAIRPGFCPLSSTCPRKGPSCWPILHRSAGKPGEDDPLRSLLESRTGLSGHFAPDSFVAAQYMPNHIAFPLQFRMLEGDQVLLPGVSVIKTPDHTPGHQSVLVRLDSGASYIFAGDAISLEDNLIYKIPGSNTWSAQQSTDSIYRLEHLSHILSAQIIPSHDIQKWSELKKCPEFYD